MKRLGRVVCLLSGLLFLSLAAAVDAAPSVSVRRYTLLDQRPVWPGDFNGDASPTWLAARALTRTPHP